LDFQAFHRLAFPHAVLVVQPEPMAQSGAQHAVKHVAEAVQIAQPHRSVQQRK
jgi:hypothetical protein